MDYTISNVLLLPNNENRLEEKLVPHWMSSCQQDEKQEDGSYRVNSFHSVTHRLMSSSIDINQWQNAAINRRNNSHRRQKSKRNLDQNTTHSEQQNTGVDTGFLWQFIRNLDSTNRDDDSDEMTSEEKQVLYRAVQSGDVDLVDEIFFQLPCADINMTWFSENLLMAAVRARHTDMALFLLDNGVDHNYVATRIELTTTDSGHVTECYPISCRQMAYECGMLDVVDVIDDLNGHAWRTVKLVQRAKRFKRMRPLPTNQSTTDDGDVQFSELNPAVGHVASNQFDPQISKRQNSSSAKRSNIIVKTRPEVGSAGTREILGSSTGQTYNDEHQLQTPLSTSQRLVSRRPTTSPVHRIVCPTKRLTAEWSIGQRQEPCQTSPERRPRTGRLPSTRSPTVAPQSSARSRRYHAGCFSAVPRIVISPRSGTSADKPALLHYNFRQLKPNCAILNEIKPRNRTEESLSQITAKAVISDVEPEPRRIRIMSPWKDDCLERIELFVRRSARQNSCSRRRVQSSPQRREITTFFQPNKMQVTEHSELNPRPATTGTRGNKNWC